MSENERIQTKPLVNQITPLVQRQVEADEDEEEPIQTKSDTGQPQTISPALANRIHSLRGGGQPLPRSIRDFFEPRFGVDFGGVRVHIDAQAAQSAKGLAARAYTVGQNVVFGAGEYTPGTNVGNWLLAHELVHIMQQEGHNQQLQRDIDQAALNQCIAELGGSTSYRPGGIVSSEELEEYRMECLARQGDTQTEQSLPSSPSSRWGAFEIMGDMSFIITMRRRFDQLNATSNGKSLLDYIYVDRNADKWYNNPIHVKKSIGCAYKGHTDILAFQADDYKPDECANGTKWPDVPNYVYLHHELAHIYLWATNRGRHKEMECMATGLGEYFTSIPYNENKLRCELGLPIRPCYGPECDKHAVPSCPSDGGVSSAIETTGTESHSEQQRNIEKAAPSKITPQIQRQPVGRVDLLESELQKENAAQTKFKSNNEHLKSAELQKIYQAIEAVTTKNDDLRLAFYRRYSDYKLLKAGKEMLEKWNKEGGATLAETNPKGIFSGGGETIINPVMLEDNYPNSRLGGILIHELVHTRQSAGAIDSKKFLEGEAYGVEYFFALRQGDKARAAQIIINMCGDYSYRGGMGIFGEKGQCAQAQKLFKISYAILTVLYEIIDNGKSTYTGKPFTALKPDEARRLATQFISSGSAKEGSLKELSDWVESNLKTFPFPSQVNKYVDLYK